MHFGVKIENREKIREKRQNKKDPGFCFGFADAPRSRSTQQQPKSKFDWFKFQFFMLLKELVAGIIVPSLF